MADIFVSYKHEDREHALGLARILGERGWTVWWDDNLLAGDAWSEEIERQLKEARCVVVIWSANAVQSHWVRTEAAAALDRGILVPVVIDDVEIPLQFQLIQTLKIHEWDGQAREIERLIASVAAVLGKPPKSPRRKWTAQFWLNLLFYCAAAAITSLAIWVYLEPQISEWLFSLIVFVAAAALGVALFSAGVIRQSRRMTRVLLVLTVISGTAYALAPKPLHLVRIVPAYNLYDFDSDDRYVLTVYRGDEVFVSRPLESPQTVYVGAPKEEEEAEMKLRHGDAENVRQLRKYMTDLQPKITPAELQLWIDNRLAQRVAWPTARLSARDRVSVVLRTKAGKEVFKGAVPEDVSDTVAAVFLEERE